jgi:drug/metabolite transporter (DMT)-like permease
MLVTLLVPVSGSFLGWLVMNDQLSLHQITGALVIAAALVVIDGRVWRRIKDRYIR